MVNIESGLRAELVCCTDTLLREIACPALHQRDVAQTYRMAMESSECPRVDWAAVNAAIVKRWSMAGLKRVKEMAWSGKCFAPRPAKSGSKTAGL